MLAIVTEIRDMVVGFVSAIERLNVSMETLASCVYRQGSYGPYVNTFKYTSSHSELSEDTTFDEEIFWTDETLEEYRIHMDSKSNEFINAKKEQKRLYNEK